MTAGVTMVGADATALTFTEDAVAQSPAADPSYHMHTLA